MENYKRKPPVWFWIVGVVALLWNASGVYQYLQQAYNTEAFRSQFTPEQLELVENTPAWVTAAFAIAVFAGLIGSLALLLRKKWAKPLFLISLLAVIIHQVIYNLFIVNVMEIYGSVALVMIILVTVIALLLYWFAKQSISKKWII